MRAGMRLRYARGVRSFDELERLWQESPAPPRRSGRVRLIVVRKPGGVKECPARVPVSVALGVEGDRWNDKPGRSEAEQVTLMNARVAELIAGEHAPPEAAGDNFLVDLDLAEEALPVGAWVRVGSALLEVSAKPHTGCKKFRDRFGLQALEWVNADKPRRLRGVNCRVLKDGEVAVGDLVEVL
jgi:MOSC domain-containing protein YiiM